MLAARRLASHPLSPLALALCLAACGGTGASGGKDMSTGGGACVATPGMYPAGPYGTSPGTTIANLVMSGRRDTNKSGGITDDAEVMVKLGDYARQDVKFLAIIVGAEWCGPCKAEQPELVWMWNDFKTKNAGVEFLQVVAQNNNMTPGDTTTLDRWANAFKIPFDMAADPTSVLGPYYNLSSFPMQMVVRTCDMTIQAQSNGPPQGWLKSQLDSLLLAQ